MTGVLTLIARGDDCDTILFRLKRQQALTLQNISTILRPKNSYYSASTLTSIFFNTTKLLFKCYVVLMTQVKCKIHSCDGLQYVNSSLILFRFSPDVFTGQVIVKFNRVR